MNMITHQFASKLKFKNYLRGHYHFQLVMEEELKAHLEKFVCVSNEEWKQIVTYFKRVGYRKKENLIQEGQICKSNFFVIKGILRKFFINEKGVEQTTEFAIENWWLTDTFSFLNGSKTDFYIQAVEPVEVMQVKREDYINLLEEHPKLEKYFRCIYQKAFAATQMRIKFIYNYSREDLYHHFSTSQPEFLQRVPQYLIASYLNFTPEYLSEIRRKSIS